MIARLGAAAMLLLSCVRPAAEGAAARVEAPSGVGTQPAPIVVREGYVSKVRPGIQRPIGAAAVPIA